MARIIDLPLTSISDSTSYVPVYKDGVTYRIALTSIGGGGGVTDHGALTGLGDDDHTQYHNDARGDARYSLLGHTHNASVIANTPAGNIAATNVQAAINELDSEKFPTTGGSLSGNLDFAANGFYSTHGGGVLRGPRVLTGTFTPTSTNWYRLISVPASNSGYSVEMYFLIPSRHILMKVTFSKTTRGGGGNYGAGILKVELLGSYSYGDSHPYDWRVVDNNTNGTTFVDFRFTSADGVTARPYQLVLLHTLGIDTANPITFPVTSQGSAAGTGTTNYGFSMGSGTGDGWTRQYTLLNASNGAYQAMNNSLVISTGTASAF